MHHKRGRARNRRAGCKMCKGWKVNGIRTESRYGEQFSDHRRRHFADLERYEREHWQVHDQDAER